MSAREIIDQIPALPEQDIQLIEAALRERRALNAEAGCPEPGVALPPDRRMSKDEAMDYVFENFNGLLRRLAQ